MDYKDYYNTLGVGRDATQDEIRTAYRKLARKYHPDVSKEADAEARFKEVSEAYEVLKDAESRAAYDDLGRYRQGDSFKPPPGWSGQFHGSADGAEQFSDFFRNLFGEGRGGFQFGGGAQQTHLRANVTLEQLAGLEPLTLRLPNEHEPRTISLPAGVGDGDTLQLSGADQQDLLLEVRLRPHATFTVAGRDIHSTVSIGPAEAALGARRQVPVLGGKVNLTIPPGTTSGRKLRLKGKGLPGRPAGDHLVEVRITVPARLNDEQRKLYEALLKLETR